MNHIIHNDVSSDKVTKILMAIRELPMKFIPRSNKEAPEPFGLHSFLLLGQKNNEEIAFGLTGKFWQLNFGLIQLSSPTEFQTFSQAGCAKLVMNFTLLETKNHLCIVSTETRVFCPDKKTYILFFPYWYLIRIASGFIRKRILLQIKQKSEA